MICYKLRDRDTGLYAHRKGSSCKWVEWTQTGTIWKRRVELTLSLSKGVLSPTRWNTEGLPPNLEVVEFELREVRSLPLSQWQEERKK
jgi:hypothetical protein